METQRLLNVNEVAGRLGMGRSFTYRLLQTGELRSVKVGGARRVLVSDLEAFLRGLTDRQAGGHDDAA